MSPANLKPPVSSSASAAISAANSERVLQLVEHGRETERKLAEQMLGDAETPLDRAWLRTRILERLAKAYKATAAPSDGEAEKLRRANTRAWFLYLLPSMSEDDAAAAEVLRQSLLVQSEPNKWARYWSLVGQLRFAFAGLTNEQLKVVLDTETEDLVRMLAYARAARDGDTTSMERVKEALFADEDRQWAALRAIRVVQIDDEAVISQLCKLVDGGANSDLTYDAIQALNGVAPDSEYAKRAARALATFVDRWSSYPGRDAMRLRAVSGLGRLGRTGEAQILLEQLLDENPAIVREAARALEACLGVRTAVDRILGEAGRGAEEVRSYAHALRWLEGREEVVDQLALAMTAGNAALREIARGLLSEVGGMAAIERLRVQSNLLTQHAAFLKDSEQHVQSLFETSMKDATLGFQRALVMDHFVFYMGMLLIAASATLLLVHGGTLTADWIGTGTTGVLGVLYSLLIAKPRQQVERGVDHLMRLKIIFLGFLRQLHQTDSAYIRRLLDDKSVSPEDLKGFTGLVEAAMSKAAAQLTTGSVNLSESPPPTAR